MFKRPMFNREFLASQLGSASLVSVTVMAAFTIAIFSAQLADLV